MGCAYHLPRTATRAWRCATLSRYKHQQCPVCEVSNPRVGGYPRPNYNYRAETSAQLWPSPTALSASDYPEMHKGIDCTLVAYPWYNQHRLGVDFAPFPTTYQVYLSPDPQHAHSSAFIQQQGDSVWQQPQPRRSISYDEIKNFLQATKSHAPLPFNPTSGHSP